jgi:hypothetical protein
MRLNSATTSAVMAGLDPAIHDATRVLKDVDARDEPGHDEAGGIAP